MAKVALLIGASEYGEGLSPLPGAAKDVEAMQRVLQHPEMGSFDEVRPLLNVDPQAMQEAIETLFSGRAKEDLVLLFFSGHGIKDESGRLYLATRITRKNKQGELVKATAVPASFVQDIMSHSRSKRQVIILDCCFSGAFAEGWLAKDDGSVDVKNQLGGEGRAVLTSSTSTQYSFEQQGSELSTYTRYLVEGIETGAADQTNDGVISVDELHEYAKKKVQEAAPAMKPEIYAVREGFKIWLAKASTGDPKLRYRQEVEIYASRGEISMIGRKILDALRDNLRLLPEQTAAIEAEVLKPYREYQQKLHEYEQALIYALEREHTLSQQTQNELRRYQKILGLRDEDIAPIEARVAPQKESAPPNQIPVAIDASVTSRNEDVISTKQPHKGTAASQAETPVPTSTRLPSGFSGSASVLKNPKAFIGAGILAAVVVTFSFLVKPHDASVKSQPNPAGLPTPTASPRVSPTSQMNAKNFYDRGVDKANKKDYKGAIEDYTQALELDPNFTIAYYKRGYTRSEIEDYKAAIEDFTQYLRLNPNDVNVYNSRGNAYYNLGNYPQAIANLNKSIELNSNNAYGYHKRGLVYAAQGNYQQGIADYSKAIELNYDPLTRAYHNRGNAHKTLGDYKKAIEDYNQVISLDSDFVYAYYNRASARKSLGDKQGAIADYRKAADLYQKQGKTKNYQDALDKIKALEQ
ncbi:caspase, EACC1-associated type [Scytonema sp. PCC 10023]|uniref:caspase, EACC1-associated type n=1 Tax=Scytonema sp. PCC 10023 TaxID=1680591 RepID=UPI0039C698AF